MADEQEQKSEIRNPAERVEEMKTEVKEEKKEKSTEKKLEKTKKVEEKIELEREYIIPLRKNFLKVPRYKRAKRAVRTIKEFLAKHMKVEDRDLKKVKVDIYLNNEVWFRGIKKPMNKIKVKAMKKGGVVYVELADIPEAVKFKIAKEKKSVEKIRSVKVQKHEKKKPETEEQKTDEKEKEKASVEEGLKVQKELAKEMKHTIKPKVGKEEATKIHRKSMKK